MQAYKHVVFLLVVSWGQGWMPYLDQLEVGRPRELQI